DLYLKNIKSKDVIDEFCHLLTEAPMVEVLARLCNEESKYPFDGIQPWSQGYYFLYEFEMYNSAGQAGIKTWVNPNKSKHEIEHILPQRHRDKGGYWETLWPNEAEADVYKHRLGNLTLTNGNQVLGRVSFTRKKDHNKPDHYDYRHQDATASEKRIPSEFPGADWTSKEILERELAMLKWAANRWGDIPCCCDVKQEIKMLDTTRHSGEIIEINADPSMCFEKSGQQVPGDEGEEKGIKPLVEDDEE
ncbi:TPA: HNH endonuclease, partial [Candidatus Poribacteria bacterium]|nr:HNH endonuclease [Candidatus Poribacteria bacterium]